MSTFPGAAQVRVFSNGRAVKVQIGRAKAIYARAGIEAIAQGDDTVVIAFGSGLPSNNYVLAGLTLVNTNATDAFYTIKGVSLLSQVGFTVKISAPALTTGLSLHWAIAETYNP